MSLFGTDLIGLHMSVDVAKSADGYLINPDEWTEDIAVELAAEEDIELNDDVWLALNFMREYYNEHKIAPDVRHLITHVAKICECDKREAKKRIFLWFPFGYVQQACKIAGMKTPRAWSTG